MYLNDYMGEIIAQERHQELLEEVEVNRLLRLLEETNNSQPKFWRQLRRRVGSSMISAGHRLQAQPECRNL